MFTAPQRTVTALVLASPALKSEADEPKVGKDPRPVWIVHAADKAESAEATKRRLLDRCDKTDVTMTSFPVLEKLPAAHLAAFARYAQVLDTLADLGSGATRPPEQGVQRIRGLQVLVRGRDLLKDPDLGLNQPVALRYAANTAELDRAFLADLRDKAKALVQDRDALAAQIEKTLAEARAAGERRLDVIRKSKLDEPRRKAAIERFCQENFPWPDLVQAAQAAPQGAPAAPAKPGGQTGKPAADKAKDGKTVTEADFLAIMRGRCVRCHRETGTVDGLKQKHWLVPGQPDRSAAYTVIGKHRKAGATYHNVPEQEKQAIHDFIDGLKP
jgi:mono/diheme cytochrome c family protein